MFESYPLELQNPRCCSRITGIFFSGLNLIMFEELDKTD